MEENQNINTGYSIHFMGLNLLTILGIPQVLSGILCILGMIFLAFYGTYPQELSVLYFQMACCATGGISILLGLESIVFPSKETRGVRNALIFDIIVSTLLGIVLVATAHNFASNYLGETIMGSELDLWEDSVLTFYGICYYLGLVASFILFLSLLLSAFLLFKNIKEV